jgi:hypothetical protein
MIREMFLAVAAGVQPTGASLGQRLVTTSGAKCAPKIVEMFGLPGVGKSTLVTAVADHGYQQTRQKLTAAWGRLSLRQRSAFVLGSLRNVRCLASGVRFAFRTRLTSVESLVRLMRLIAKTHWLRAQSGGMLLDQGYLQEIWSICIAAGRSNPDQRALAQLIRCLYAGLDPRIVFIEADAALASQRLSSRNYGFSRLDGLAAAVVEARLARAAQLPHAIIAAATAAGVPVERLDGSDPVKANADRLRKLLLPKPSGPTSE